MVLDVLLWVSVAVWAGFTLNFIGNLIFMGPRLPDAPEPDGNWPSVSIVVPARNEGKGIRAGVTSFCSQDYPSLEVISPSPSTSHGTSSSSAPYGNLRGG